MKIITFGDNLVPQQAHGNEFVHHFPPYMWGSSSLLLKCLKSWCDIMRPTSHPGVEVWISPRANASLSQRWCISSLHFTKLLIRHFLFQAWCSGFTVFYYKHFIKWYHYIILRLGYRIRLNCLGSFGSARLGRQGAGRTWWRFNCFSFRFGKWP